MNIPDNSPAVATDLDAQRLPPLLTRLTALTRISDLAIALGLLLICFISRLIAIPASMWEWDDILFARALNEYNLVENSPHPPGFPVFVAMARAVYWVLKDEHLALSTVSLIFASLLAPALFYFYREVFSDRAVAFAGALLGSFAPNVWVHSGAGRSDEVALTLGIIGLTLVIHGLKSQRSLIAGCAVFGLAMGVRVTLLPAMAPVIALVYLILLRRRRWRPVAAALAAGAICLLLWFAPFIYKVTWTDFRYVMHAHTQFAWETDTIISNTQNGILSYRLRRFFGEIWGARWIMWTIYILSAFGLIALAVKRRWKAIGWMALAFLPVMIFTLLLNTPLSAPLYSLPYIPLFVGLAACGLVMVPRLFLTKGRWGSLKNAGLFLAVGLTIGIAEWTYPVIKLLHREESPPVRALNYIKQKFDPKRDVLYLDEIFLPHALFYLPGSRIVTRDHETLPEANLIRPIPDWPPSIWLTLDPLPGRDRKDFGWTSSRRGERRLRPLSLGRYFEAHVSDSSNTRGIVLLSGWHGPERDESKTWQWMSREGKLALLNVAESMTLRLQGLVAIPPKSNRNSTVVFRLEGVEIDRVTPNGTSIDHTLVLKPDPARLWSVLSIETDQVINPRRDAAIDDDRDLGIQCLAIELSPAPGAPLKTLSPDLYVGPGWHPLESNKYGYWRWTNESAITHLPVVDGEARLDLKMLVAARKDGRIPEVSVEVGGNLIEKFQPPSDYFTKTFYVPKSIHRGKEAELKLSVPPGDGSDPTSRAMLIYYLGWRPSEKDGR
jgi:Dolichyl-phosphate-mannose-protein mannosyltransferase